MNLSDLQVLKIGCKNIKMSVSNQIFTDYQRFRQIFPPIREHTCWGQVYALPPPQAATSGLMSLRRLRLCHPPWTILSLFQTRCLYGRFWCSMICKGRREPCRSNLPCRKQRWWHHVPSRTWTVFRASLQLENRLSHVWWALRSYHDWDRKSVV